MADNINILDMETTHTLGELASIFRISRTTDLSNIESGWDSVLSGSDNSIAIEKKTATVKQFWMIMEHGMTELRWRRP